jgi:benzoyl-CoA reductase/2-hydroxyglutaryl-CoA dehydratase subunit BcrC/BadD/HgdB
MLAVTVAGTAMPRERYNQLLRELVDEAGRSVGKGGYRARLMLLGSLLDNPAYVDVIEEQGGLVVTDSLCLGSRLVWVDVDEGARDPLTALARYYIADRPHCPRMSGTQQARADFVMDMIREFNVDGVIGERLMFCDYWATEHYIFTSDFKEEDIPFLKIDREYLLGGVGQLRTRVQAFLETMGR